jgi:hypothetical protein
MFSDAPAEDEDMSFKSPILHWTGVPIWCGAQAREIAFGPEKPKKLLLVPGERISSEDLETRIWLFRSGNLPTLRIPLHD